jgi:hypothetical protein
MPYEDKLAETRELFANANCSTLSDSLTSELFQNENAGNDKDMSGTAQQLSKPNDAASNSSFLHETQVPDLGSEVKKDSVTFETF